MSQDQVEIAADGPPGVTPTEWRAAMGRFPSGVTVVTAWDGQAALGATVSSFCSVALEPPLLLVCLDRTNVVRDPIVRGGVFGVNFLAEGDHHLARQFGSLPDTGRFAGHAFFAEEGEAPRLAEAAVFIHCHVETTHPAGDHLIVVGRGQRIVHATTGSPLLYHKGGFPLLRTAE